MAGLGSDLTATAVHSVPAYLVAFFLPWADGFFPAVPGETVVIAIGVVAAETSDPRVFALFAVAVLGGWAGDQTAYLLGRWGGRRAERRLRRRRAGVRALGWVDRQLASRDVALLLSARFVPLGRTAVSLTIGTRRYRWRRFAVLDGVAALLWATFAGSLGYVGGRTFTDQPLLALVAGMAGGLVVVAAGETVRRFRH